MLQVKLSKKEHLLQEVKDILSVILYLAVSLSIVATFKGLVLIQTGIDEFAHLYTLAIVNALALGKFAAISQNLPIMNAWDRKSLIWSVLYKSAIMTVIIYFASEIEEAIFASLTKHSNPAPLHPVIFVIAHQLLALLIFVILFTVRGINHKLGPGKLWQIMIGNTCKE